jgi:hypothetical protein
MNRMDVIGALTLPPESLIDQRVPKKLLVENGAPTAADKRQINEGIEELIWLAALKPVNIGVPGYRDENREYLEIAVLSLSLRPAGKALRLQELVHRAIPYPVVLLARQTDICMLSLAHKRWSQGEEGKVVLDNAIVCCELADGDTRTAFLGSLALTAQPRVHLLALYEGWIDCLEAYRAAKITGRFEKSAGTKSAGIRRDALLDYESLTHNIAVLRSQAEREPQINRRVDINLEIKRLEAKLAEVTERL